MTAARTMHRGAACLLALLIATMLAALPGRAREAQQPRPPDAEQIAVEIETHGHIRTDEYRWMSDGAPEALNDYLDAEDEYARAVLAPLRGYENALYAELAGRLSPSREIIPWRSGDYLYGQRYADGADQPVYWRARANERAEEQVLLDGPALARGHAHFQIGAFSVAPDDAHLAYSIDTSGDGRYRLFVRTLDDDGNNPSGGAPALAAIDDVAAGFAFSNSARVLYYLALEPGTLRAYRLMRRSLDAPDREDELVYEETDARFFLTLNRSRSGRYIIATACNWESAEHRLIDADADDAAPVLVAARTPGMLSRIDHFADAFWMLTNDGAPNFRLLSSPRHDAQAANWREVIEPRDDVALENFILFEDRIALQERIEAASHIRLISFEGERLADIPQGEPARTISLTGVARDVVNPDPAARFLRYGAESLVSPASVYEYDFDANSARLLRQDEIGAGFDEADYLTTRIDIAAPDAADIPVTLAWRADLRTPSEAQPLLLTAYGAYGHTLDPSFASWLASLYDRGFIVAVAHVRGGGARGRAWRDAGRGAQAHQRVDDFITVAEALIAEGYTAPDRLFARAASAGALMTAAAANERPELFRGLILAAPFLDPVTAMQNPAAPLTTFEYEEWGDPAVPGAYRAMVALSPYDGVRAQAFPHVFASTGRNDVRAPAWHAAKWTARLRDRVSDAPLILLDSTLSSGHGAASARSAALRLHAREIVFMLALSPPTDDNSAEMPGLRGALAAAQEAEDASQNGRDEGEGR